MKIVDREEFLAMPEGTLYAKCDNAGGCLGPLQIMLGRCGADFVYRDLIEVDADSGEARMDLMLDAWDKGTAVPLDWDWAGGRDGYFDTGQRFAVLDKDEATGILNLIKLACANGAQA